MIDELRLNTKLIGFDGIIGRRDYFLNLVCLGMFSTIFTTPLTCYWVCNVETFTDFFSFGTIFWNSPWLLKIWVLLGAAASSYVLVSNIIRRLNDINGEINKNLIILFGTFMVLGSFNFIFPAIYTFLLSIINLGLSLFLIFRKGKITSNYPEDFRKRFNWGAFLGTWIWGLINRSYKTLWILILSFTPVGFLFQLFCGLKGNEWAYKNRRWKNDEDFKSSQEKQSIAFIVLSLVIIPIIYFLIILGLVFGLAFSSINDTKHSPKDNKNTLSSVEKVLNSFSSLYFEKYEITNDENKFYVLPSDWKGYSFKEKKEILDIAASLSANKRNETRDKNKYEHFSKTTELNRTKIYSSTNNELLGEFILDESVFETEKPDFKAIIKSTMNAYRFYKPKK